MMKNNIKVDDSVMTLQDVIKENCRKDFEKNQTSCIVKGAPAVVLEF